MTDPRHAPPHGPAQPLPDAGLDALLRTAPEPAPADFADRVLQRLADRDTVAPLLRQPARPQPAPRWRRLAERAALLAAATLGMGQVLAFIFGLWAATATA